MPARSAAEPDGHSESPHSDLLNPGEVDQLLTWTLVRAARRVERMLVDLFATYRLTPAQFGVLIYLGADAELTQSQLARKVLIRPQSVNTVITDLVDRGLLERVGPGGRGRPTPIRLTPAGVELLRSMLPTVLRVNQPARLGLEPRQAAKLNEILLEVLHSDLPTEFEIEFRSATAESPATPGPNPPKRSARFS